MSSASQGTITREFHGGILTLVLDRPARANAVSSPMLEALQAELTSAGNDPSLRAVVITGAGDRVFSGGADLAEMAFAENDPDFAASYYGLWDEALKAIQDFPLPVIALVNGACVAGGLSLALACDIRIATGNAVLSYPRIADGHLPGRHNLTGLVDLIGPSRARLVMLCGYRVGAAEAHTWGLVDTLIDRDAQSSDVGSDGASDRRPSATELLSNLGSSDPQILRITKALSRNVNDDEAWSWAEAALQNNPGDSGKTGSRR